MLSFSHFGGVVGVQRLVVVFEMIDDDVERLGDIVGGTVLHTFGSVGCQVRPRSGTDVAALLPTHHLPLLGGLACTLCLHTVVRSAKIMPPANEGNSGCAMIRFLGGIVGGSIKAPGNVI